MMPSATPQLLELQPAESFPAATASQSLKCQVGIVKRIDVHLFIKHLQTNSPQKVTLKNDPFESDFFLVTSRVYKVCIHIIMDDSIYTVRLLVTSNHQVVPRLQPTYNYLKKSHFEAIYDLHAEDTKDIRRSEIFSERAFGEVYYEIPILEHSIYDQNPHTPRECREAGHSQT
jgi:hypothetical protein